MKTVSAFETSNEAAYIAGFNCGMNGADTSNCHFRYFATEALKNCWENGKSAGEMARAAEGKTGANNEKG